MLRDILKPAWSQEYGEVPRLIANDFDNRGYHFSDTVDVHGYIYFVKKYYSCCNFYQYDYEILIIELIGLISLVIITLR